MRRVALSLLVLVALAVVADRAASVYAAHRISATVSNTEGLPDDPGVAIHGIPFLTQLVGGDYEDIEATVHNLRRNQLNIDRIDVHLRGARVPFGDVIAGDVNEVPVDHLDGVVHIAYDDLSAAARNNVTVAYAGNGKVSVTGVVAAGAQRTDVVATGDVRLSGQRLTITISQVRAVGGAEVSAAVGTLARSELGFSVRVPNLPFGIELQSAKAEKDGISLGARGSDVTLRVGS